MRKIILYGAAIAFLALKASSAHAVLIGDSGGGLWDLDTSSNTSSFIGSTPVMFDIAQNPTDNQVYGVTGTGGLYSIDASNANTTLIGLTGAFVNGLTFSSSGMLFGAGNSSLYDINLSNGSANLLGNTGFTSSGDLAFDNAGTLFLSASGGVGGDQLVSLNTATGSGTLIGDIGFSSVYGLNYSNSSLFGFTLAGQTLNINTASGQGTLLASNGISANGADGAGGVSQVPLPGTLSLLGIGFIGFAASQRTKRS